MLFLPLRLYDSHATELIHRDSVQQCSQSWCSMCGEDCVRGEGELNHAFPSGDLTYKTSANPSRNLQPLSSSRTLETLSFKHRRHLTAQSARITFGKAINCFTRCVRLASVRLPVAQSCIPSLVLLNTRRYPTPQSLEMAASTKRQQSRPRRSG